jgi:hypothetical protein
LTHANVPAAIPMTPALVNPINQGFGQFTLPTLKEL